MRKPAVLALLLFLAATATAVFLAQAQDRRPFSDAPVYRLPIFFARELPPRCREHATGRRHDFARADLSAGAGYDIVYVGDSLMEGWLMLPLRREQRVANRGIACDTTNGLHERLNRDVIAHHPKIAVLLIGINDLYLMSNLPAWDRAKHVAINVTSIALRLKGHGIQPLVLSLLPVRISFTNLGADRTNELIRDTNNDLRLHLRQMGADYYNVNASLVDDQKWLHEDFSADGLHINTAGYQRLTLLVESRLKQMLR